jgi:UDP-N-acetylmuramoylalanine--D-glutamate ligase
MNLKQSPHIAVFLNIYPEHGDYYQNFNQYLKAKQNICKWQTKNDFFVYNPNNKYVKETAKITKAKKIPIKIRKILKQKEMTLIGEFNLQNLAAAIKVTEILKISNKKIQKAIKNFKNLPHRLEYVGTFRKIKFYNDSLATIPEATIEAIKTLGNNLETIILGGFERRQDFKKLAKEILKSKIKTIILFPTTGQRIWKEIFKLTLNKNLGIQHFFVSDMQKAIRLAYKFTKPGKICILSPASASFNLFKDYKERGDLFKKYVKKLQKKE